MDSDSTVRIGEPLPKLASVRPARGFVVHVTWSKGLRAGEREEVDLAPAIFRFNVYRALRDDPELFRSVRVVHGGNAIAWGDLDEDSPDLVDMGAGMIEDLAGQQMSSLDFKAWLERNGFGVEEAAMELGVQSRVVEYYLLSGQPVPKTLALACAYLDGKRIAAA